MDSMGNTPDPYQQKIAKKAEQILAHCCKPNKNSLLLESQSLWVKSLEIRDWTGLKSLTITRCNVDDKCIALIVGYPWNNLEILGLNVNRITDVGLAQLCQHSLPKLKSLNLTSNRIGNQNTQNLCQKIEKGLTELKLGQNYVTNIFISKAMSYDLSQLVGLYLSRSNIDKYGVRALVKLNLDRIRVLFMDH